MQITSHSYPVARLAISAVDWHPATSGKDQYTDGQISTEDWNSVGVSGGASGAVEYDVVLVAGDCGGGGSVNP